LKENLAIRDEEGRTKLYADIAHPINSTCRETIQKRVIEAFTEEKEEAKLPGYVSSYDDFEHDDTYTEEPSDAASTAGPAQVQQAEKPHGPHKAPPRRPQPSSRPDRREFGAGIFD
jgi:stage V sporulation protein G